MILASRNDHKVRELGEMLPGVELRPLPDEVPSPVEDGDTFTANALIKARSAREVTGEPIMVLNDEGHHAYRPRPLTEAEKLTSEAKDFVAEKGYDVQYGARPLKRAIQKYLEDEMAEVIIKSEIQVGDTILVGLDKEKEEIKIDIVKPSAKAHPKKGK